MSAMEWNVTAQQWLKECSVCSTIYKVDGESHEDAFNNMSKHFAIYNREVGAGLTAQCRECGNHARAGRKSNGLTRSEMAEKQDNKCAVCERILDYSNPYRTYVDHDHTTGITRALLCAKCNTMMYGVDNEEWLTKAIAYRDSFR